VLFVLAALFILLLTVPAPGPTGFDQDLTDLLQGLPGLVGWFWEVAYDLLLVWALALMVMALAAHGRTRLFFDEVLAVLVALGFGLLAGAAAGTDWSDSLGSMTASEGPPVYVAVRLALATAVVVTASPHMTHSLRTIGRGVVLLGALAAIALGVAAPIGVVAALVVGLGSAALVHLLVGSPGGRLTLGQVAAALEEIGVEAADLRDAPSPPQGVQLVAASSGDGHRLIVKIFGRDAWDGQLLASSWNALRHRGAKPQLRAGRLEIVEHEAFVTLLAERGGVPVRPIVAAGTAAEGDALLVTGGAGRSFGSLDRGEIDDELLLKMWEAADRLRSLGLAHRQLDGSRLVVLEDGSLAVADFAHARVAATRADLMTDRVHLLVTMALAVGHERAVEVTIRALGSDGLAEFLPYLQPTVLERATWHAVKEKEWTVEELRDLAVRETRTEQLKLAQVRRVSLGSIVKLVLIALLAYGLIAAFQGVDFDQIVDELQSADLQWLLAALLLSPVVQLGQAFSTLGASLHPVRYGPVLMLQYAIQFIALAVPSSAARVALEIRFFQSIGVAVGGATSIGVIDSLSGFTIQVALILIISVSGLVTLDLSSTSSSDSSSDSSSSSGSSDVWILLVALLVIGVVVTLAVPKFRRALREAVPRYRAMVRDQASEARTALRVLRSPRKVLYLFGGNLFAQVLLAVILGLCLQAFGYSASMAQLILINTFVSLFAGFMPVPGGMGVAEAGYTAGLEAIGIPSAAALATAIAFRLVTFYLPPIWGVIAMRWLRRHSFV
jgi:uncharacterized protein (TIRG00374 family)